MYRILRFIWFFLGVIFILSFVYISETRGFNNIIKSVNIISSDKSESSDYLDKLIKTNLSEYNIKLIGEKAEQIPYKTLESLLNTSKLIKKVSTYRTWKGNFFIELTTRHPIARIIYSNGKNFYIDETGFLIPSSLKYQFKVLTINYDKFIGNRSSKNISEYDSKLLKLLLYIDKDKFLKAQISHLEITDNGFIKIFTQISKQFIEFGQPENLDCKFEKFKILYKKILPKKGWNSYNRANLEFDKQIICE